MSKVTQRWGRNIRARRLLLEVTQGELAARLGVDQTTVSRWELGISPPPHMQPRIAAALDVDPATLFDYEPEVAS